MAILDEFEVSVEVDKNTLPEYDDEELDALAAQSLFPTIAKYVEVQSGKPFGVHLRLNKGLQFKPNANSLAWRTSLDGRRVDNLLMKQDEYIDSLDQWSGLVASKRTNCDGQWIKYPFIFSNLDITQDKVKGDHKAITEKYGSLGTIEVEVNQYCYTSQSTSERINEHAPKPSKSVPEKALKGRAVTLGAGCGDPVPGSKITTYNGFNIDEYPIVKFVFHYRSKKSLQDLLIIPKEVREAQDEQDAPDDIEDLTAEELRLLLRKERENNLAKIKKEANTGIKREAVLDVDDDDILDIREVKKVKLFTTEVIEIDSD